MHEMANTTYILCPGQGAQVVGMGKDFTSPRPRRRRSSMPPIACSGFDLASLCFSGPEEQLNQTDISQPAIYTTASPLPRGRRGGQDRAGRGDARTRA